MVSYGHRSETFSFVIAIDRRQAAGMAYSKIGGRIWLNQIIEVTMEPLVCSPLTTIDIN